MALRLRVENPSTWVLAGEPSDQVLGGVRYVHDAQGNHYQPWVVRGSERADFGSPFPQLRMAAEAVERAWTGERDG